MVLAEPGARPFDVTTEEGSKKKRLIDENRETWTTTGGIGNSISKRSTFKRRSHPLWKSTGSSTHGRRGGTRFLILLRAWKLIYNTHRHGSPQIGGNCHFCHISCRQEERWSYRPIRVMGAVWVGKKEDNPGTLSKGLQKFMVKRGEMVGENCCLAPSGNSKITSLERGKHSKTPPRELQSGVNPLKRS